MINQKYYILIYFGIVLRFYWSKYNTKNPAVDGEGLNTASYDMTFNDNIQTNYTERWNFFKNNYYFKNERNML